MELQGTANVILATDVLYDKETVTSLAKAIQQIATSTGEGCLVLVCDPQQERTPGIRQMFQQALGFTDGQVQWQRLPPPSYSITHKNHVAPSTTMEGRDYQRRLQNEPVVLLHCRLFQK
jgi:hypothetical protein